MSVNTLRLTATPGIAGSTHAVHAAIHCVHRAEELVARTPDRQWLELYEEILNGLLDADLVLHEVLTLLEGER